MKIRRGVMRSRIARRIVALFVLCALVPVMAMAVLSYDRVHKLLVDQGSTQLAQLNGAYATALYDRLLSVHVQLRETASSLEAGAPQWSSEFKEHLKSRFDAIMVVRPDSIPTALLGDARSPPDLTIAERTRLAKGGTILKTSDANDPSSPILIARALDPQRPNDGILVAELNKKSLWDDVDEIAPIAVFCVVNDRGKLLYCSQPDPPAMLLQLAGHLPPLASGRFEYAYDGRTQLANHRELFLEPRFLVQGWTVIASRPQAEVLAPLGDFEMIFLPAVVLSLLVAALLSLTQVRRTLVPLEKLIDGTRRAANKDFSTRVAVSGNDEFSELATSFNAMNTRLGNQFTALTTLAEIDRAILSRLDVDRVIETVVTRIRDIVQTDYISVAVLDRTAAGMMRIYTRDQHGDEHISLERSACPAEDTLELLSHPSGMWFDPREIPKAYALPVKWLGAAAVFACPIIWQEHVVGMVVLGFRGDASLTPDEEARTRDLGDRVGVAYAAATKDEQLYYQAHYDQLTGLPNRLYFRDQLDRTLARAHRGQERFAVLFVDLDYFKRVNDSLGHAAGDAVLRDAADRMRRCIRGTDIVARLGGDEFTLLLTDVKSTRDPQIAAEHVIAAMATPFLIAGQDHFMNASIGIAIYPDDGVTADELLRNADTAMYRAKDSGRGQSVFFENRMNADAIARVRSERELHHAIDRNEFVLVYQPQLDLKTCRISGAEALLRWNHPDRGLLAPAHFIQLAEETGLIEKLGEWVLREACAQFQKWQADGIALPRVGVNVSPRQFQQKGFIDTLDKIVRDSGMRASSLEVEITESLLLEATSTVETMLMKLKSIGVQIALDDFGTGYSSLAYLKRFPVDVVKIDRSFVKDLPADEGSAAITAAIIAMAHALRKKVVAEGVETAAQAAFLRGLRCDHIQGYHLSVPLSPSDLAALVQRAEGRMATAA
ncbi:MAG TPA: EAL domain-containing protein [Casimicrobiaceae bacterium]|nr:EAL domain-containing protein [Casimicrobiaceae bacterium]